MDTSRECCLLVNFTYSSSLITFLIDNPEQSG